MDVDEEHSIADIACTKRLLQTGVDKPLFASSMAASSLEEMPFASENCAFAKGLIAGSQTLFFFFEIRKNKGNGIIWSNNRLEAVGELSGDEQNKLSEVDGSAKPPAQRLAYLQDRLLLP